MIIRFILISIFSAIGFFSVGQTYNPIQQPDFLSIIYLNKYYIGTNPYDKNFQIAMLEDQLHRFYAHVNSENDGNLLKFPGTIPQLGDSSRAVYKLRENLILKGFLSDNQLNSKFDADLESAIISFQKAINLTPDGIPGRQTYARLNISAEWIIQKLENNLNRLYREPDNKDSSFILVNIPEFKLTYYDDVKVVFETSVAVGKPNNSTPILASEIDYLVFNPCWTIPNSIAVKSILPKLKTDSTYLDKRNMFIQQNGSTVNHHEVDFSEYSALNFPFKVFQNTDQWNALGKVKFMFDNQYSIYLHDTPTKSAFKKSNKAISHGCVRVQNAMQLAHLICETQGTLNTSMDKALEKGYPEKVFLKQKLPVKFVYRTCYYDANLHKMQYVNDVYGYDN